MDRRDTDPELDALLASVLARTSGPVCGRAHELLPDDDLAETDRRLLALHLEGCAACRALAATLAALSEDLSTFAEVRPDPDFLEGVLAYTSRAAPAAASRLPAAARPRRPAPGWAGALAGAWRRSWPLWVRRPRFAWEAAFALTLVLVPVFAAAGSPLQPVGERAIELSRENPVARLEVPTAEAEERLGSVVRSLEESEAARWAGRRIADSRAVLAGLGRRADALAEKGRAELGTLFESAASLLTRGEWTPDPEPDETHEETP